jgi:hypothetical protein
VTAQTFQAQIRDRVRELLDREVHDYLGPGSRLQSVHLDDAGAILTIRFSRASRPDVIREWRWAFPGTPPSDHELTPHDINAYAGWVLVCLQEAVAGIHE